MPDRGEQVEGQVAGREGQHARGEYQPGQRPARVVAHDTEDHRARADHADGAPKDHVPGRERVVGRGERRHDQQVPGREHPERHVAPFRRTA